jgi:glycerophosphoryl diester phosphodiesterase
MVWIIFCTLIVLLLYRIKNEPIALFFLDVRYRFNINPNFLWYILFAWLLITIICLAAYINEKKGLVFSWEIRIGKRTFTLDFPTVFQKVLNPAIAVGVFAAALLLFSFFHQMNTSVDSEADNEWTQYPIAHALGSIDGIHYTNSLEAFETNYALGQRVFEVDFCVTSDNKMVLSHYWEEGYQEGIDIEHVPTEEEFLSVPILGKYTPLALKDLIAIMQEHEDIYIVTDTKDHTPASLVQQEFEEFLETAQEMGAEDVLDRIIVQIYKEEMLETVNEVYEFPTYIFTMYQRWNNRSLPDFREICEFSREHNIKYITMYHTRATEEVVALAKAYGLEIYVHTVNDLEKAETYLDRGVYGIYTDDITLDMLTESSAEEE